VSLENNQPIIQATVQVKGKTIPTTTNNDRSFTLNIPSGATTVVISYVGFVSVEKNIDENTSDITITLTESSSDLNAVVVTALGIQRQSKTLVYATQTVKTSELTTVRDPNNVINSLQGKVANALITQGSGGPGSGARI